MNKWIKILLVVCLLAFSTDLFAKGFSSSGKSSGSSAARSSTSSSSRSSYSPSKSYSAPKSTSPSPSYSPSKSSSSPSKSWDSGASKSSKIDYGKSIFNKTDEKPFSSKPITVPKPVDIKPKENTYQYRDTTPEYRRETPRTIPEPRPVIVYNYRDSIGPIFWTWLIVQSIDTQANWLYHHRSEIDSSRYNDAISKNPQIADKIKTLENNNVKTNVNYSPVQNNNKSTGPNYILILAISTVVIMFLWIIAAMMYKG